MKTFAKEQSQPRKQGFSSVAEPHTRLFDFNRRTNFLPSTSAAPSRFAHDFSSVPVSPRRPPGSQVRFTVNTPNDMAEREADTVADQITRMPGKQVPAVSYASLPNAFSGIAAPVVQPKRQGGSTAVSDILNRKISSSLGGGSQMDSATQRSMKHGFGRDFSHIRIHADSDAAQMSHDVGAYAFTVGRDIYFGSAAYSPHTREGARLLAHELTHTIQQGNSNAIQRQATVGLGVVSDEPHVKATAGPEAAPDLAEEDDALEAGSPAQQTDMYIQRSTTWAGATVHEALNEADDALRGGNPVTWQMLNGTMLKTDADADSAVKLPTVSTSGADKKWTAKVDTVPAQEGGDDETVLSPGPWSIVAPKTEVDAKFGNGTCTGAGNSTFSVIGKPSDDAVYKANRRHEDHHVSDDKVAFEQTVGVWDKKLEDAKKAGKGFHGEDAAKAEAALWAAMGGEAKQVARKYSALSFAKGGQFHNTAKGGPMSLSNYKASADCSTSSIEVTNPS